MCAKFHPIIFRIGGDIKGPKVACFRWLGALQVLNGGFSASSHGGLIHTYVCGEAELEISENNFQINFSQRF